MISRPYTHLVGACCTVYAYTFFEALVVFIKCSEQCFILRSYALLGIAYHFGCYKCLSVRHALIVLDDLSLDVIQSQIDVSRFFALTICPITLGIPHCFCNVQFATELCQRTIDCNSPHNGDNTVFLLTAIHVEQHLKCTSHNPIFFGYKISYQRVVHCYAECGRE